jgi:hypothetical protein
MATFAWDLDAAGAAAGDEVTVTTGNAGTDGPTAVNSVAGGTRVYDDDQAPAGLTWSVRLATGATSGTSNMVWDSTRIPATAQAYFRIPFRFSSLSANRSIGRVRSGSTQILRVHHTADGRLEIRDSGNSVAASGTVAMPTDTWIEIGVLADPGSPSTCVLRWWQWGADATDFEDEVSVSDDFSAAATVNELTVGNIAAGANISQYWVGPVRYDSAGWPGPLATSVEGSLGVALPALTAALAGAVEVPGQAAVGLPALVVGLDGTVADPGALTAALPALTVSAAGAVRVPGTLNVDLPAIAVQAVGAVRVPGVLSATLAPLDVDAAGTAGAAGALVVTLPALTVQAAGTVAVPGTLGAALPPLGVALDGAVRVGSVADVDLPALAAAAAGRVSTAGVLAAVLPSLTAAIAGAAAPARPGVHTAGAARPVHAASAARAGHTAAANRAALTAGSSRG